ncbi:MAG: hypothetical protein KDD05_09440 [Psychroserpens sp.]|nr:hypothetical protein [Psychroserpens sp.]
MKQKSTALPLRQTIIIFFIVLFANTLPSQVITDKAKAPLNPTGPYILYARNYDTKGDVASINFTLYDRSGVPIDDRISYDKDIARQHKKTYHKVEQGWITEVIEYQYSPAVESFQYNNHLIIREENETWIYHYTYDDQKRLIQNQAEHKTDSRKHMTSTYAYENLADGQLKINIIVNYNDGTEATTGSKIFKDGLLIKDMSRNVYTYDFDSKGNYINKRWSGFINGQIARDIVYYSDLEQIDQQGYVPWKKGYLYGTKLPVPLAQLRGLSIQKSSAILSERVLENGVLFYLPTLQNYYYSANVFDESKLIGTTGNAKLAIQDTEAVMQSNGKQVTQLYKGRKVKNGINVFWGDSYFVYDTIKQRGFYNKTYKTPDKMFYNSKVLEGDAYVFSVDPAGKTYGFYVKGKPIDYTKVGSWKYTKAGDPIIIYNGHPIAILEGYFNIKERMLSVAKPYAGEQIFDVPNANTNTNVETNVSAKQSTGTTTVDLCISGNCTNGYGTYAFKSGSQLVGFFKDGKANGFGELIFANGDSYRGHFNNGQRSGFGIYDWKANNEQYYGHWKDGKQHGYGYYYNSNKLIEAGIYTQGKLTTNLLTDYLNKKTNGVNCLGDCQNGYGVIKYNQGDIYSGFFKNGLPYKAGSYKWKAQGYFYVGDWDAQGKINYSGMYVTDTFVYIGAFAHNGELTGLAVKTDKKTQQQTYGEFKNGNLVVDYAEGFSANTNTNNTTTSTTASELIDQAVLSLAKLYVSTYYNKGKTEFKQMVVNQHNNLAKQVNVDRLTKDHTAMIQRLYQLDKVVAHRYLLYLPNPYARTNTGAILEGLSSEERTFIREESRRITSQYKLKEQYVPKN